MIMDSKGKLFGKVSIVDVAVILAVIIAIGGVYVRFFAKAGKTVVTLSDFNYTMKIENIRKTTAEALKQSVGQKFNLNEKVNSEMGVLKDVKLTPAVGVIEKTNGEVVNAEIPENFDAVLTFQIQGRVNEKGYFTPQLKEINSGTMYIVKSKIVSVYGVATKVWE